MLLHRSVISSAYLKLQMIRPLTTTPVPVVSVVPLLMPSEYMIGKTSDNLLDVLTMIV